MSHETESHQENIGAWAVVLLLALVIVVLLAVQDSPVKSSEPTELPEQTAMPEEAEVEQLVPSPAPAVHLAQWWDEPAAHRDLGLVAEMPGFYWVKQKFAWRDIEGAGKGIFDWSRADRFVEMAEEWDLYLIARLDRQPGWAQADGGEVLLENAPPTNLDDFEDFCYAIADRYQGRIKAYQVWNEPNLAREWGGQPPNAADYVELLVHCYRGIKQGDPEAIVISAGLAPTGTGPPIAVPDDEYLRQMYEAGAAEYFDMLGVNAPGYGAPPWLSPEETASSPGYGGFRWASFRHVEDIREIMIDEGDRQKQIAILEMGWTLDPLNEEYRWFAVSEEQQAEYLEAAYWWARMNWQPWIGIMTTIYIPDSFWTPQNEQYWWSITLPGWPETQTRKAYEALKGLPDWSDGFYRGW